MHYFLATADDKNETMIMAFDSTESGAQNDFDKALEYLSDSRRGAHALLQDHISKCLNES